MLVIGPGRVKTHKLGLFEHEYGIELGFKPSWIAGDASIPGIEESTFSEMELCKALLADWLYTPVL